MYMYMYVHMYCTSLKSSNMILEPSAWFAASTIEGEE